MISLMSNVSLWPIVRPQNTLSFCGELGLTKLSWIDNWHLLNADINFVVFFTQIIEKPQNILLNPSLKKCIWSSHVFVTCPGKILFYNTMVRPWIRLTGPLDKLFVFFLLFLWHNHLARATKPTYERNRICLLFIIN